MRRFIALAIAAIAAMFVLVGCVQDSTANVKVIGDNVALLPEGGTMVLHKSGKYGYTWLITYNGESTVHFHKGSNFGDTDVDITADSEGKEVAFETGGLLTPNMYVSRRSDDAVNVRWDDGLTFQAA